MAKKTVGYVELEWTCPRCGSKNPGPRKICSGCGGPQPDDVEFEQLAQEQLIEDEKKLEEAKSGPDIHCGYCGARNPANAKVCSQCAGDLTQGAARQAGRVVGSFRKERAEDVPCPSCGALNPANAQECSQCGGSMAGPKPTPPPVQTSAPSKGCGVWPFIAVAVVGVIAIIGFIVLSSRTTDTVGSVESASWSRSIAIQELGPVTYQDWKDEIPSEAVLGPCTDKVHHTQDQPAPGAREVCGTPYTVDQGSGYGEVVQDCEYQVMADWCDYTVNEWRTVDTVVAKGDDQSPYWPDTNLISGQQEGDRSEKYQVLLDTDGKDYTYVPQDQSEFSQFQPGTRWILKVNTFDAVLSVEPAR